uniref:Homologous-pairing protein 2 homolog n=1 Tax=Petromyzon marinus TaxID=7757 RepID=S4RKG4_PETMA
MSKAKDVTVVSAPGVILNYLNHQNRPYSAQDIQGNLNKQHAFGKTAVVKALDQLAQEGQIKEKVYGKQKIYFANQDQFPIVADNELKDLDQKIVELNQGIKENQQVCKELDTELRGLTNSMVTEDLKGETERLRADCSALEERLNTIKNSSNVVTPEEKEEVYKHRVQYVKEWRRRKRMATDMIDAVLEGYPKTKKHFYEEVGIETDDDHKVTIPNI